MGAAEKARCSKRVYSRYDFGGHRCGNWAAPGDPDGLCQVHRRQADKASAPPPEPVPARSAPSVTTSSRTTVVARLEWGAGEGPRFKRPYHSQLVEWRSIWASAYPPDHRVSAVEGSGFVVKASGEAGQVEVRARYMSAGDVPPAVLEALDAALQSGADQ